MIKFENVLSNRGENPKDIYVKKRDIKNLEVPHKIDDEVSNIIKNGLVPGGPNGPPDPNEILLYTMIVYLKDKSRIFLRTYLYENIINWSEMVLDAMRENKKPTMNGCVHIHMKNGRPISAVVHIGKKWIPDNGVIHAKLDEIYTNEEFIKSHPKEKNEGKLPGISLKIY